MTRTELLKILTRCRNNGDTESAHMDADRALIDYINDPEITAAYDAAPKWYA